MRTPGGGWNCHLWGPRWGLHSREERAGGRDRGRACRDDCVRGHQRLPTGTRDSPFNTCRLDPSRLVARWSLTREAWPDHGELATSTSPSPHHQARRGCRGLWQDHLGLVRLSQDTNPGPGRRQVDEVMVSQDKFTSEEENLVEDVIECEDGRLGVLCGPVEAPPWAAGCRSGSRQAAGCRGGPSSRVSLALCHGVMVSRCNHVIVSWCHSIRMSGCFCVG